VLIGMRRRLYVSLGYALLGAVADAGAADPLPSLHIFTVDPSVRPATVGDLPDVTDLRLSRRLAGAEATDKIRHDVFVKADHVSGRNENEMVAEGNVEVRRAGTSLTADRVVYWPLSDELDAVGGIRLEHGRDIISGPHLHFKVTDQIGFFEQPSYSLTRSPPKERDPLALPRQPVTGSGEASRIDFAGEGLYRLFGATYSTCAPGARDWYAQADEIELDYNRETGEAKNARIVFKDSTLLYTPWLTFSLNDKRKSGVLPPTIGTSTNSGFDVTVPYYWNIAPDMDATISPRLMARRGLQINTEFRYLEDDYNGQSHFEYLAHDKMLGKSRSAFAVIHNQALSPRWTANLNINGVSDDTYFSDLSPRLWMVTQTNLLRQGAINYAGGWWNGSLTAQRFQTLQDPSAPVAVPYYRMPQLSFSGTRSDLPAATQFAFSAEYVRFGHPTQVTGERAVFYPQVSWPMQGAAWFVRPKLGMHVSRYQLDRADGDGPTQINRELPIASVDAGAVFERPVNWFGHTQTQTLEPRLYYVYIPVRDQSRIPVFDSALTDFNFGQIFLENRYSGSDRIGDARQLTAVALSRLIDPDTGLETLRAAVGQRYYFSTQTVTLPGEVPRSNRKTDFLAALSGRLTERTYFDGGWQYNPAVNRTERVDLALRYQPEMAKVINAGYRFTRDQFAQVDISAQWPLSGRWHGVGRYNYSTRDHKLIEGLAGIEYDGGCWAARVVLHRMATQTAETSTALFFQWELSGLGRIGINPLDLLKRSIPGYGVINQPTADPIFGAY
jgi:LPS-assembly protein